MIDRDGFLKLGGVRERVLFLPEDAGQVTVQGLSAEQVLHLAEIEGRPAQAAYLLTCGLVEPEITQDDARVFLTQADHTLATVLIEAINELSGLAEGAQKSD